jgi:hypothetical protein
MRRSKLICRAMMDGFRKLGIGNRVAVLEQSEWKRARARTIIFYGLFGKLAEALKWQEKDGGTAVYIDLGYFGRREGGRFTGYHKLSVNGRHPTAYFQNRKHPPDRLAHFNIVPEPWREGGRHILLAGMGDKGCVAEGYLPTQWEKEVISELRRHTDRPIIYRPKPSWRGAKPIEGVGFSPRDQEIEIALTDCHAVVTHHSNAGVDGLIAGIPCFTEQGVAKPMSLSGLNLIEMPRHPEDRGQWLSDVCWTQWNPEEMSLGLPWRHLLDEGLVK